MLKYQYCQGHVGGNARCPLFFSILLSLLCNIILVFVVNVSTLRELCVITSDQNKKERSIYLVLATYGLSSSPSGKNDQRDFCICSLHKQTSGIILTMFQLMNQSHYEYEKPVLSKIKIDFVLHSHSVLSIIVLMNKISDINRNSFLSPDL